MTERPVNGPVPKNLKTSITDGQRYYDEPVYDELRANPLALAVNAAFSPVQGVPRVASRIRILSHYNRVRLRWMKPDGRGGLVPR